MKWAQIDERAGLYRIIYAVYSQHPCSFLNQEKGLILVMDHGGGIMHIALIGLDITGQHIFHKIVVCLTEGGIYACLIVFHIITGHVS